MLAVLGTVLGGGGPAFLSVAIIQSHYETLGLTQAAKPEQIKRSYRTLAKRFRPDLFPVKGCDAVRLSISFLGVKR